MPFLQDLTRSDLETFLLSYVRVGGRPRDLSESEAERKKKNLSRIRAKQIFNWIYQRQVSDYDQMTDLPKDFREDLKKDLPIYQLDTKVVRHSEDGTIKFLWNLKDQKTIESVLIPAAKSDRLTLCISSQVGCAMACKFCLTGVQGLDRHLEIHEIVSQVREVRKSAPVTNIVFMGMGEPLHNVENVIQACRILVDQESMNFSKRKVTVSTSGIVPAIDRLGQEVGVSLAVSLNAPTDEQRTQIMPVNKKWNIAELLAACQRYPRGRFRRMMFEYVLIKDFNDQPKDSHALLKLVRDLPVKVNLIPYNPHSGAVFERPDDDRVMAFQRVLLDAGVTATVRRSRGRDILAACGQLRSLFGTARGTEKHRDEAYRASL